MIFAVSRSVCPVYVAFLLAKLLFCPGDVFQHARDKIGLPANVPLALYEEVHAGRTDELTPTKLLGEVHQHCISESSLPCLTVHVKC